MIGRKHFRRGLTLSLFAASTCCTKVDGALLSNASVPTQCAEDDNVTFYVNAPGIDSFTITASHPTYQVQTPSCDANFANCPPASGDDFEFAEAETVVYDDHVWTVTAYRQQFWWRPSGMTVTGPKGSLSDAHWIGVGRRLENLDTWPQFFVLYSDGNSRMIPHPAVGAPPPCYGSSVLIGPTTPSARPVAEIESITIDAGDRLTATYRDGGHCEVVLNVNRDSATATVGIGYSTENAFVAFRSMHVDANNCDAERMQTTCDGVVVSDSDVLSPQSSRGDEFFLYRSQVSVHNQSAPDTHIAVSSCTGGGNPLQPARLISMDR